MKFPVIFTVLATAIALAPIDAMAQAKPATAKAPPKSSKAPKRYTIDQSSI